jgi:hypothetical protein
MSTQIPKERFMTSFYPALFTLALDGVANMRLAVARLTHNGFLCGTDGDEIRNAISNNANDKIVDRDVVYFVTSPSSREDATHLDYTHWKTREHRYGIRRGNTQQQNKQEETSADKTYEKGDEDVVI